MQKKKAQDNAELAGYGMSGDVFILLLHQRMEMVVIEMKEALETSNTNPDQIDYINHGTSTVKGDEIEINAISRLFPKSVKVSSTKSSIGHLLGAAGSVESIFSILSIRNNTIPATINLDNPINSMVLI